MEKDFEVSNIRLKGESRGRINRTVPFISQQAVLHPWKISEAIKIFLVTQISVLLVYLFIGLTFGIDFGNSYFNLAFISISSIALLLAAVYHVKHKYTLPIKSALNLQYLTPIKLLLFLVVGIFMAVILNSVIPKLSTAHSFASKFVTTNLAIAISIFDVIFIAPVCEEIYWRGFVYPAVKNRFSLAMTILMVSFVVTLVHLPGLHGIWDSLIMVFVANIVLTLIRYRTNSTLSCIIAHVAYNATVIIMPIMVRLLS